MSRRPLRRGRRSAVAGALVAGAFLAGLGAGFDGGRVTEVVTKEPDREVVAGALGGDVVEGPGGVTVGGPAGAAGGASGGPTGAGSGGLGQATDRGVTADTINLVVLLADTGAAASFGIDGYLGDIKGAFQAYIDEANEAGGFYGRKVKPTFVTFDPLNYDSLTNACTQATEDVASFAVVDVGLYYGPAILCITEQHRTPMITYEGEPDEWYRRSEGRFLSLGISKSRMMRILPRELERLGLLRGGKLGVLGVEFPTDNSAIVDHLLPGLRALGYDPTYFEISQDLTTSQAQMPIAVQTMQQAGVDKLILTGNLLVNQPFVQQADRRQYEPQYFVADFACGTCDLATTLMPESFDGTIGITTGRAGSERLGLPQPPYERECTDRYTRQTGTPVAYGFPMDPNYTVTLICTIMDRLFAGFRGAGPTLTRETFVQAGQRTGRFDASGVLAASYGPGKYDAPDAVRTMRWNFRYQGEECRCFLPVDDPRPAPGS